MKAEVGLMRRERGRRTISQQAAAAAGASDTTAIAIALDASPSCSDSNNNRGADSTDSKSQIRYCALPVARTAAVMMLAAGLHDRCSCCCCCLQVATALVSGGTMVLSSTNSIIYRSQPHR